MFLGSIVLMALAAPTDAPIVKEKVDLSEPTSPVGNPGRWVTNDDYPATAIINGREGTSGFLLKIDANGVPTDCTIKSSSGSADLDEATCRLIMARARFRPGRDETGRPTGGTYSNRIRWQIPKDPISAEMAEKPGFQTGPFDVLLPRPPLPTGATMALGQDEVYPAAALSHGDEGVVSMSLTISATGSVTGCSIVESSHSDVLDQASCDLMRKKATFRPALDNKGQPTAGAFIAKYNWILPDKPDVADADDAKLVGALDDLPPRLPDFPINESGETVLSLTVEADGSIVDCHFDGKGPFMPPAQDSDICAAFKAVPHYAPFLGKDGKPEARHILFRTDLSVDPVGTKSSVGGN